MRDSHRTLIEQIEEGFEFADECARWKSTADEVVNLRAEIARLREAWQREHDAAIRAEERAKLAEQNAANMKALYMDSGDSDVEQLRAENARLREAARWIPCSEQSMPLDTDIWVIVRDNATEKQYMLPSSVYICEGALYYASDDLLVSDELCPTHWRALPEGPEVETK